MATRISFMTHYPDRMGDLAGKPTYFIEKIWSGLGYSNDKVKFIEHGHYRRQCKLITGSEWDNEYPNIRWTYHPKTTTIRSNYEYWKSKEGQLIQPYFLAGKPYRSKHVVFCPEVRLRRVRKIETIREKKWVIIGGCNLFSGTMLKPIIQNEGFDHPGHFWMWFDKDFDGALLELENVGG